MYPGVSKGLTRTFFFNERRITAPARALEGRLKERGLSGSSSLTSLDSESAEELVKQVNISYFITAPKSKWELIWDSGSSRLRTTLRLRLRCST